MASLIINPKKVEEKIVKFIKNEINKTGFTKAIIGISGGIDSTLCAYLAVKALGQQNVIGVIMPYETSNPESAEDAKYIVKELGIISEFVDITPMVNAYYLKYSEADKIRRGNKMARERMSILYDLSREYKAIVVGTGNKTELFLGYGTLYGDMACGIAPLLNLYKTQVRQLAGYIGIPQRIIEKVPSADLWKGQTDEGELGVDYDTADKVLDHIIDRKTPIKAIIKKGFDPNIVAMLTAKIKASEFKRRLPVAPKP